MAERLREARSDAAHVEQRSFEVGPHDQRTERVLPLALPRCDACNHAIERRLLLDLDPVLAPLPGTVSSILSFRNDPFEAACDDRVVIVDPAGLDVLAEDD